MKFIFKFSAILGLLAIGFIAYMALSIFGISSWKRFACPSGNKLSFTETWMRKESSKFYTLSVAYNGAEIYDFPLGAVNQPEFPAFWKLMPVANFTGQDLQKLETDLESRDRIFRTHFYLPVASYRANETQFNEIVDCYRKNKVTIDTYLGTITTPKAGLAMITFNPLWQGKWDERYKYTDQIWRFKFSCNNNWKSLGTAVRSNGFLTAYDSHKDFPEFNISPGNPAMLGYIRNGGKQLVLRSEAVRKKIKESACSFQNGTSVLDQFEVSVASSNDPMLTASREFYDYRW